mmetsp:Transcript_46107/g.82985  ORF Transcript_46107/g.82985 Transcript_46107/m.82985 type:complete len:519 (-) Transcript_46107:49-1605(-)
MGNFNGYFQKQAKELFADFYPSEDLGYTCIHDNLTTVNPDRWSDSARYEKFRDEKKPTTPIWAVAVAELNRLIAGATSDHCVHLWDEADCELKVTMRGHTDQVWDLKFATNETTLASASADLTIRLWDSKYGSPLGVLRGHKAPIRTLSFSYSGYLLSGDMDGRLFLWEAENAAPVKEWKAHEGSIHMVAFSWAADHHKNELPMALSVGHDGSVANWFINRYEEEIMMGGRFPGGDGHAVLCVAAHPKDSGIAAVGNEDGTVWLWFFDETNRAGNAEIEGHSRMQGHVQAVWYVEFDRYACYLVSGSADGTVRVWDVRNPHSAFLTTLFRASETWVKQVRFYGGPVRSLVTCSTDGLVKIWRAPKRMQKKTTIEQERLKPWQQLQNKIGELVGLETEEEPVEAQENEPLSIEDQARDTTAIEAPSQLSIEGAQEPTSETTLALQSTDPSVLDVQTPAQPSPPSEPPLVTHPGQPEIDSERMVQPPKPPDTAPKRGTPGLGQKLQGAAPKPPTLSSTLT